MDTTVHVIGKCVVKGCKSRKRHTVPARIETDRYGTRTRWAINTEQGLMSPYSLWDGETPALGRLALYMKGERCEVRVWAEAMLNYGWVCPEHDRVMKVTAVAGVVSVDKSCDGRCMSATNGSCECACGGENHGARWS